MQARFHRLLVIPGAWVPGLFVLVGLSACKTEGSKPISKDVGPEESGSPETGEAVEREIDRICPGDTACESNEGPLQGGAAQADITPCFETWLDSDADWVYNSARDSFLDCGCDQRCPGDEGYTSPDEGEADGEFQAAWLAGFGQGRAAMSSHDPIEARVVYIASGDTSVAIVSLDVVGWFWDDAVAVREAAAEAGATVDLVVVHATHNHEAPDSMGQWGAYFGRRGVNEAWRAETIARVGALVAQAEAAAVPVDLVVGAESSSAPFGEKGTRNTIRDSRDPLVVDEMVGAAALVAADGSTVATLINWGNHPEVLGGDNTEMTSDFSHYLRRTVEEGISLGDRNEEGRGGTAIFLNAGVGGLMTPLGITVTDWAGVDHSGETFEKAQALGEVIGGLALEAVREGTTADSPRVSFKVEEFDLLVENIGFQALFLAGVFERSIFGYDNTRPIDDDNIPRIRTEMDWIEIGPLRILTVPGELFPELAIGGYDGSRANTNEDDFIDPGNENPPDLSLAPEGPYLKDQLAGEHNWILGLGNDEVGYLVPPYDYVLDPDTPFLAEAAGHHYEETNSLGPGTVPEILRVAELLTQSE
jgi:hypothetical protein